MSRTVSSIVLLGMICLALAKIPDLAEIKILLHVYFPNLNENTTIYSFLSDERNVQLLDKVHLHSCLDLKRRRKIRSFDWFWNEFTLPVDRLILNGTTFTEPVFYTLNDTEEQRYSHENKFFNPWSPSPLDNSTQPDDLDVNVTTPDGPTCWPTDAYGDRIPKKHMKAMDYINMINNDASIEKDAAGAGGCPLGFGRG